MSGSRYRHVASFAPKTDRKSTRLNSSHSQISYAVFCLKKKKSLAFGIGPRPGVEGTGCNRARVIRFLESPAVAGRDVPRGAPAVSSELAPITRTRRQPL